MIEPGDTLTIAGVYGLERNPDRKWWQLWKPCWVAMSDPQCFKVIARG